MALPPLEGIVYGPIHSRRLGTSLGINLLPAGAKICNMDCAYCQYGWSRGAVRYRGQGIGWPAVGAVTAAVAARLEQAAARNEWIDRLTIAGHGEPTLHPEFEEVVTRLHETRDRVAPRVPIAILSNSTTAGSADVRRALMLLDERYMKLDAGDPLMFARVNGGGTSVLRVIDGLCLLSPITVQAMFVRDRNGEIDNSTEGAVTEWLAALEKIRVQRVHVYTLDRPPALTSLAPVSRRRLREIAEHVRAMGVPADVFTPARQPRARRPPAGSVPEVGQDGGGPRRP
jgi:wyosine [tRNA(Phe)-imidazoG37] synthetase (radical SAM superfamily)